LKACALRERVEDPSQIGVIESQIWRPANQAQTPIAKSVSRARFVSPSLTRNR
jgi:hypothetical protein